MNKTAFVIGAWLACGAGWMPAQITVQLVLPQDQFLRNESLPIKVRVANSSGQTLHLGGEADWLSFEMRDNDGRDVARLAPVPLADAFDLAASQTANLSVDLMPCFELSKPGRYTVRTVLKAGQVAQVVASIPRSFDIISGTKLWEREFGVPSAGVPEPRKYALQQANFLKQLRLYVRVTDPNENKVFRVVPLGMLISFSSPEAMLDKSSNLHVLFQTGAQRFLYNIVGPDGELIIRQTHEYFNGSRPILKPDDDLGVKVVGGRRIVFLSDIPPPPDEPVLPPQTLPTNAPPKNTKKSKK